MSGVNIKICGLSTAESVTAAAEAGTDFLGFIFYPPSPRNIEPAFAASLAALVQIPAVAVTVDATDEQFENILRHFTPAYLQLHGNESPARVAEIKRRYNLPVIKAFSIRSAEDFDKVEAYADSADMYLFDAPPPKTGLPGGNGLAFDWSLLSGKTFLKPWFLSGGLNADNVEEAVSASSAAQLDVSSGVETSPGQKDAKRIRAFLQAAKRIFL